MTKKKLNYKKLMIQIFLIEIIAILIGFIFVMKPKAEIINSVENISYVSPQVGNPTFVRQLYYGNRWSGVSVGQSLALDYYVVDYSYRMTDASRHYNVFFQVYGSMGQKGTITLNNQACQVYDNDRNNSDTNSTINNAVFNVACIDISSDQNQFQLVLRYDTTWSPYADNLYMVKQGFFVSSYPTEQQALNNAMSDLANSINTNQTDNTNRIINSVNNMTSQLINKQNEANQISQATLDYIKDDTVPNSNYTFSPDFTDGGILTTLVSLPIQLVSSLSSALSRSCSPFVVSLPFVNKDLTIPCINNIFNEIGATPFFESVGAIAGGFLLYEYLKYLAVLFDKSIRFNLTLKDVL